MFIHVGTLTSVHGLKGELRVAWYASSPLSTGRLFLSLGAQAPRPVRIAAVRRHKGGPLVLLEGVEDRSAAQALRGGTLLVPEQELPPAGDEIYLYQLSGLEVVLHENGRSIGRIDHVEFPAGQEIWVIRAPDGREVLFPAAPAFVESVDMEAGRAHIKPPPGLLEVYLGEDPD